MPDENAEAKARRPGNKRKRAEVDGRGPEPTREQAAGVCKSCYAGAHTSDSDSPAAPFAHRVQVLKQVLRTDSSSAELSISEDEDGHGVANPVQPATAEKEGTDGEEDDGEDDDDEEEDEEFLDYAVLQEKETSDQPLVTWGKRHKPMMEQPAGSDVWVQVVVVQTREDQILVRYTVPRTKVIRSEWVFRSSSRLWRGSNAGRLWKYLGGKYGDGTWRPRAPEEVPKGRKARARLVPRPPKSQTTATGGRTSGSGAVGAGKGEEPDVASPRKRPRARNEGEDSEEARSGGQRHARARAKGAAVRRVERDLLASWFQRHYAALDEQHLLGASFAEGAPEAGWLPPPDAGQLGRGKAGPAARAGHVVAPDDKPQHAAADANAPTSQHQLERQQQSGRSSTQAPTGPSGQPLSPSQTAAGGALEAGGPPAAFEPGLHSTQQPDRARDGTESQHKPGFGFKQPSLIDEQRLFGVGLSSPSSHERSHGVGELSKLTAPDSGAVRSGPVHSGASLLKTKSLPKNVKGREEELPERPERSVRSDSAPLRGSVSLTWKARGRPSDSGPGSCQLQPPSTASKAASSVKSLSHKDAADRLLSRAHAGQAPKSRPAAAQGADAAPAGRKHAVGAKIIVPMADDEQPGGFQDRSGRHAPQKHGAVQPSATIRAAAGKGAHHGVRVNGFHARPAQS